jgi:hypothetical protein
LPDQQIDYLDRRGQSQHLFLMRPGRIFSHNEEDLLQIHMGIEGPMQDSSEKKLGDLYFLENCLWNEQENIVILGQTYSIDHGQNSERPIETNTIAKFFEV